MDGSQVTGASSSYARKYALNGIFAIDDNKDSDSTNTHGEKPKDEAPKVQKNITPRERLINRLHELGININAYAKANNLTASATDDTYLRLLKELDNA
jgi:hypothetical protein